MSLAWLPWFRYAVLAVVGVLTLLAFAAMAVQRRSINPFGHTARLIRRLSDPVLRPIERRAIRAGGTPASAPWWLVGIALVGGIVTVSLVQWVATQALMVQTARQFGQQTLTFMLVTWAFNLFWFALLIRVIGSWLGMGRYNAWMKPFYWVTEWMLAPLRRIIPPFGQFDLSPLIALVLLSVVKSIVLRML